MKVTDFNEVYAAALAEVEDEGSKLTEYVDTATAAVVIMNIYNMADQVTGFGQDINGKISVISNNRRISVIANGMASTYKHSTVLCDYEDLNGDIFMISVVLDAAIQRMEENGV